HVCICLHQQCGGDRIPAGHHHIVGEDKCIHGCYHQVSHENHVAVWIRESSDMVNGDAVERVLRPRVPDLKRSAGTQILGVEVIDNDVMDTPASTGQSLGSITAVSGHCCCQLESATGMRDVYVANGDVGHLADGTNFRAVREVLVLGGEENAI